MHVEAPGGGDLLRTDDQGAIVLGLPLEQHEIAAVVDSRANAQTKAIMLLLSEVARLEARVTELERFR